MDDDTEEEVRHAKASGDQFLIDYMVDQSGSCAKGEDIAWLKSLTKLPVLVKGVLTGMPDVSFPRKRCFVMLTIDCKWNVVAKNFYRCPLCAKYIHLLSY